MLEFRLWLGDELTHGAKNAGCCMLPVDDLYLVIYDWRLDVCREIWLQVLLVRTMNIWIWGTHKDYSFSQMESEYIPLFRLVAFLLLLIFPVFEDMLPKAACYYSPFQVAQEACNKLREKFPSSRRRNSN